MPSPDADTLIAIKQLITDPLLREVRTTIEAGHAQQARQISGIAAGLKLHDAQLEALRADVGALKAFKRRVAAVCALGALVGGTLWGLVVDWFKAEFLTAKP